MTVGSENDIPEAPVEPVNRPAASPPRPRGSGAGIMMLAVCGFLALSLMYMESAKLPIIAGRVVADLAFLIPLVLSVVLCVVNYRRARGVEARFWLIGASLNAVLLTAELYFLWFIVTGGPPPPIYAPFQILHVAAAALFLALLATMVRLADTPAPMQARWWLDLAAVAAVVYVIALRIFVEPLFAKIPEATAATNLIGSVYTAWGVMMLVGGIWILVRPGLMRWRLWERMIGVSLMIYSAGVMLWPVWFAAFRDGGSADERSVLDLVLVLGHYLFVMAAAERLLNADQAWPMRRLGPAKSVSGRTATYAVLGVSVVALPVLVASAVLAPAGTLDRTVFACAAAFIAALMVGRTIVSAIENGRLFHTSVSDPLTGLYNHRYFHERLAAEIAGAQRYGEQVAVLWLDVDDFTRLNRLAGHAAGDDLLRHVADALTSVAGEHDVVCRIGGDEFAVIARGKNAAEALELGCRIEAALAASAPGAAAPSLSGGIAMHPTDGEEAAQLAQLAERTSRWAHHRGKGRVLLYDAERIGEAPDSEQGMHEIEEKSRLGTLRALAAAVDARREASGTRSATVAALSGALARQLGLDEERVKLIEVAALVHDVGMVSLSDDLLAKPEALTPEETAEMQRHPALGERIVGASAPPEVVPWIRHHHERWDGDGYPDGLRAVAIPLESRIIGVCDAWDAMISERPWRRAMSATEAVAELRACAGTQFDPELVEPLIRLVEAFYRL